MIKDWLKTIRSMYRLRYIVGYNGFIYKLKLLPLIGRLLPDDLYSIGFFKVIYAIWKFIAEFFMLFFLKVLGLSGIYAFSFIMRELAESSPEEIGGVSIAQFQGTQFMMLFLAYAFAGILINTNLFSYTPEKEYAVFMLRMDAKKINISYFALNLAALFIGYSGVNLFFGIISGMPFLMWFFTPLLAVAIKLAGAGIKLGIINLKRRIGLKVASGKSELVGIFFKVFIGFTIITAVLIMSFNAYCPPVFVLPVIAAVTAVLAVAGFFAVKDFDPYLHKQLLAGSKETYEVEKKSYKSPDRTKRLKKVNKVSAIDTRVSSNKKGFAFLNQVFARRYRSVISVRPIVISLVIAVIFALICIDLYIEYGQDFGQQAASECLKNNIVNFLTFQGYQDSLRPIVTGDAEIQDFFMGLFDTNLLAFFWLIALSNGTTKLTQTMFINCDRCLMSFSFYKSPAQIVKLYKIRITEAIKLNLAPAIVLGLVFDVFVFMFGGQRYPGQYLVIPVAFVLMSALCSVHLLTLYYLLQPYTENIKVKNHLHTVLEVVSETLVIAVCWIPVKGWILVPVLIILNALYIFLASKLVAKISPKHWKVRT
jgi:hypothetical protein